jgi:hypothetical protein
LRLSSPACFWTRGRHTENINTYYKGNILQMTLNLLKKFAIEELLEKKKLLKALQQNCY